MTSPYTPNNQVRIPVIVGPTASGKSSMGLQIAAKDRGVEIISADSRQIYREISIGTAKPSHQEQRAVPHHCIDLVSISSRYSAGQFSRDARLAIKSIYARSGKPLIVGGSGFYVKALFEGLAAPPLSKKTFEELSLRFMDEGIDQIYQQLVDVDPVSAEAIPLENSERIIRALGCFIDTGSPFSSFSVDTEGANLSRFHPVYISLMPDRDALWERIDQRTGEMLRSGLVEETEELLRKGFRTDAPGLRTVGYRQVLEVIDGGSSRDALREDIFIATRRYAKRQRTWFKNQLSPFLTLSSSEQWSEALEVCEETWKGI